MNWLTGFYPIALYSVLVVILFHTVISGHSTFLVSWDSSIQSFAWLNHNFRSLQQGSFALWDFSTFSGSSFVGELQTAPFYPLTILFSLFSKVGDPFFVDLLILLHFFFAAYFTHLLLRELGLGIYGCITGAVIFAFCGPVAARATGQPNLHAGLVFIPLVLLLALKGLQTPTFRLAIKWILATGVVLGMTILAGHVHSYIHEVGCLGVFCLFFPNRFRNSTPTNRLSLSSKTAFLFSVTVVSVLFSAVQIVPTYEYLKLAYKWFGTSMTRFPHVVPFEEYTANSLDFQGIQSLIDVSKPVGTTDLTTLYIGLPALILVLFSFLHWRSPIFKFGLLISVLAFVIAASGDSILGKTIYSIPILNLVRIPTRALHLWGFSAALLAAVGIESTLALSRKNIARILLLVLFGGGTLAEIYRFSQLLTGPIDSDLAPHVFYENNAIVSELRDLSQEDRGQFRYTSRPKELIPPNLGEVYNLHGINGHRSSMHAIYTDFLGRDTDIHSENYDLLSVKWVVSTEQIDDLRLIAEKDGKYLYERPNPLPVFWILTSAGERITAAVKKIDWQTNSVNVRLEGHTGGWLIFSQPVYPGWKAYVDDQPREISEYEIFNKIELRPGDQIVRWEYSPWFFPLLGWFSLLIVIIPVGLFLCDSWVAFKKPGDQNSSN